MAFQNKNMSVIACANGFTLWHYTSTDTIADISKTGYFNKIITLSNTGDVIIINAGDGTAIKTIVLESNNVNLGKVQL